MSSVKPTMEILPEYRFCFTIGFDDSRKFVEQVIQSRTLFENYFYPTIKLIAAEANVPVIEAAELYAIFCNKYPTIRIEPTDTKKVIMECDIIAGVIYVGNSFSANINSRMAQDEIGKRNFIYCVKLLHEVQHLVTAAFLDSSKEKDTPIKLGSIVKLISLIEQPKYKSHFTKKLFGDSGHVFEEVTLGGRIGIAFPQNKQHAFKVQIEFYYAFSATTVEEVEKASLVSFPIPPAVCQLAFERLLSGDLIHARYAIQTAVGAASCTAIQLSSTAIQVSSTNPIMDSSVTIVTSSSAQAALDVDIQAPIHITSSDETGSWIGKRGRGDDEGGAEVAQVTKKISTKGSGASPFFTDSTSGYSATRKEGDVKEDVDDGEQDDGEDGEEAEDRQTLLRLLAQPFVFLDNGRKT